MGKLKQKEIADMESMADLWETDIRNQTDAYERASKGYAINLEEVVTLGRRAILEGDGRTEHLHVRFQKVIEDEE